MSVSRTRLYSVAELVEILEMPIATVRWSLARLSILGEMHDSPNTMGPRRIKMYRGTAIQEIKNYRKSLHRVEA